MISQKEVFSQQNRVLNNQDTIYYVKNNWNRKINNVLVPFDTSNVIIQFSSSVSRGAIIDYLQLKNLHMIDSLFDYKLCKLDSSWSFNRSLDTFSNNNLFESVELNYSGVLTSNPNDPFFDSQLYLDDNSNTSINVVNSWSRSYGNSNVIVAVIDQYPDWSHEDLGFTTTDNYENIWKNPKEDAWSTPDDPLTGNGIDDDGNGLIDDWKGWDFRNMDNDTRPSVNDDGHGTQIAGIIAAKTNNNTGISGIAGGNNGSGVSIMPINILKEHNSNEIIFTVFDLAKAVNYAAENNANIIALSLTFGFVKYNTTFSGLLDYTFDKVYNQYNVLTFCSSGNYNTGEIEYPSSHPFVYSVGGINKSATQNIYTHGTYSVNRILDFVALAMEVSSIDAGNQYISDLWGTSFASPQASGVASLILSNYPCLTNSLIYNTMKETAKKDVFPNYENEFQYENGTLSDYFGYGIPNALDAITLLISYEVNSYLISSSEVFDSHKIALDNIIIESGGILTVTSDLYMSENKKIVVEPGGKLIIDGGTITSGCGWKGIEVNGIANTNQNTSSFGVVEMKNEGLIEHAMIGIRSIDGGIVKTSSDAVFRNNYQSIVFDNYNKNHQYTQINDTKFIGDGPILGLLKGSNGKVQSIKEFIRINETANIRIKDCEFTSEFQSKGYYGKGIGINAFNAKAVYIQDGCEFNGLSLGINFASQNGLLNFVSISDNTFNYVNAPIKIYNSRAAVTNNTINLESNADIIPNSFIPSVGIFTHGSVSTITNNNISSSMNDDGYGIVIRNSKSNFESKIEDNEFENLRYGTQLEQANRSLRIYCNSYTDITESSWSINPVYAGDNLLPMQGYEGLSLDPGKRRAGNLFYDRNLENKPYNHIRSSFDFVYNAATDPDESVPEYVSSNVTVATYIESNALSCENLSIPCENAPCPPHEWADLLTNAPRDSVPYYFQQLLTALATEGEINEAISLLNSYTDSLDYLELLIGIQINLNAYETAHGLLQIHPLITKRDTDYYKFYTSMLNREFNNLPQDSIPNADLITYLEIINNQNDISDLVMAFLNFQFDSTFVITPEEWEEENSRPIINPKSNKETREYNQKSNINTTVFPNPTDHELLVSFNSNEYEALTIRLSNILGETIIGNRSIIKEKQTQIDVSTIPGGIYYLHFYSERNRVSTEKVVIIH